ncbi:hypothetical protein [Alloscardovia criceti]|uniref:hypothetical protein n=1 Tax=Alloscardovia criceti TaxID=356828 RepID=UPI000379668B|nr:hypothetical protein [Alloscardovia criceti]
MSMSVDKYLMRASALFDQISTVDQWQKLARMVCALYAHDVPTSIMLDSVMSEPPFLLCSVMQAASFTLPHDSRMVDVIVPDIVRVQRSQGDIDMVTPLRIGVPESMRGSNYPLTEVGIVNAVGQFQPVFQVDAEKTVTTRVLELEWGQRIGVRGDTRVKAHVSIQPVRAFTYSYEVTVTTDTQSVIIRVKTPNPGVAHTGKALRQVMTSQGDAAPVQFATHGAHVETWHVVTRVYEIDSYRQEPSLFSASVRLRERAVRGVDRAHHYTNYVLHRVLSVLRMRGWDAVLIEDAAHDVMVSDAHITIGQNRSCAAASAVSVLVYLIARAYVRDDQRIRRIALMAASLSLMMLGLDHDCVDARLTMEWVQDVDEADMARRIMIATIRCIDPTLLGTGHGTSSTYPFASMTHQPVEAISISQADATRYTVDEGVVSSIQQFDEVV